MNRSKARETALFYLFSYQFNSTLKTKGLEAYEEAEGISPDAENVDFFEALVTKALTHASYYDQLITLALQGWSLARLGQVELCLMRLAMAEYELVAFDEKFIPILISEITKLSNTYCEEKSASFLHGLLATTFHLLTSTCPVAYIEAQESFPDYPTLQSLYESQFDKKVPELERPDDLSAQAEEGGLASLAFKAKNFREESQDFSSREAYSASGTSREFAYDRKRPYGSRTPFGRDDRYARDDRYDRSARDGRYDRQDRYDRRALNDRDRRFDRKRPYDREKSYDREKPYDRERSYDWDRPYDRKKSFDQPNQVESLETQEVSMPSRPDPAQEARKRSILASARMVKVVKRRPSQAKTDSLTPNLREDLTPGKIGAPSQPQTEPGSAPSSQNPVGPGPATLPSHAPNLPLPDTLSPSSPKED